MAAAVILISASVIAFFSLRKLKKSALVAPSGDEIENEELIDAL
jgi:hypothetical protein